MGDMSELPFSMPLGKALGGRRSVRNFKPDVLTRGQVRSLLLAAVHAPTAVHQEPWAFVVVQDKAQLRRISDLAKPLHALQMQRLHVERHRHGPDPFADPAFNIFYNAGTLILVCGLADAPFLAADCWLAAENIVLAAYAAGLGSCVIGSAAAALNLEEMRRELEIPASLTVLAPIIVGVPADDAGPTARKEPRILHWSHDLV
ncbi:Nitroreductase [Burkholderiales bacterium]|nr:Nitroreductase [Burkholderiales bacterium]